MIGDSADIKARIAGAPPYGVLPKWWAFVAPIRDALIGGASDLLAACYSFIAYVKMQTRLATATGIFIDIFGYDFLGLAIVRRNGESDAIYKARVKREILRERVTRSGMIQAITDLTSFAPIIFEPWNTGDAGAWENGTFAWSAGGQGGAGGWGTQLLPNQVLMTVYMSGIGVGVANIGGWSSGSGSGATPSYGGWDAGAFAWVSMSQVAGPVTVQDVYNTILLTKPIGVTVWVKIIQSGPPTPQPWWATQLPTSAPTGGGLLWNDGGLVAITFGTASPSAMAWVLALPTSAPAPVGLLWNNGGFLALSGYGSSAGTLPWAAALSISLPATIRTLWNDGLFVALS